MEKKVNGRTRRCRVDANGFLVRVLVHPADISETEGAERLGIAHHPSFPRMHEIRGDEGCNQGLNEWLHQHTTIRPGQMRCAVIPKRRVAERSIAWGDAIAGSGEACFAAPTATRNHAKPFFLPVLLQCS